MNRHNNHKDRLSWRIFLILSIVYTLFLINNLEDIRDKQSVSQEEIATLSSSQSIAASVPDSTYSLSYITSLTPCNQSGFDVDHNLLRIRNSEILTRVSYQTDRAKFLALKPRLILPILTRRQTSSGPDDFPAA